MRYEVKNSMSCPSIPPGHTATVTVTGVTADGRVIGDWSVAPAGGWAMWWVRVQYALIYRPLHALGVHVGGPPKLTITGEMRKGAVPRETSQTPPD